MALGSFLGAQAPIIARLQALLDASITVLPARNLAGVQEMSQVTPSVQVYPGTARPVGEPNQQGAEQLIDETYTCVIVVRNVTDQQGGTAAQSDAGTLVNAVFAALGGWPPGSGYSRLKLTNPAAAPAWSPAGFGYYPITFTTRYTVRGNAPQPIGAISP